MTDLHVLFERAVESPRELTDAEFDAIVRRSRRRQRKTTAATAAGVLLVVAAMALIIAQTGSSSRSVVAPASEPSTEPATEAPLVDSGHSRQASFDACIQAAAAQGWIGETMNVLDTSLGETTIDVQQYCNERTALTPVRPEVRFEASVDKGHVVARYYTAVTKIVDGREVTEQGPELPPAEVEVFGNGPTESTTAP